MTIRDRTEKALHWKVVPRTNWSAAMTIVSEPIRNRVIERRRMRAAELRPHPQNARRHPDTQARSLEAVVREVGQVANCTPTARRNSAER